MWLLNEYYHARLLFTILNNPTSISPYLDVQTVSIACIDIVLISSFILFSLTSGVP